MKRLSYLCILVLLGTLTSCLEQESIPDEAVYVKYFARFDRFGNQIDCQRGSDIVQTQDGGFLLFGISNPCGDRTDTLKNNFYLIKTNRKGELEWSNDIGINARKALKILPGPDDDYFLLGQTIDETNDTSASLFKVDLSGDLLWEWELPVNNSAVADFALHAEGNCVFISEAELVGTQVFIIDGTNGALLTSTIFPFKGKQVKVRQEGRIAVLGNNNFDAELKVYEINPFGGNLGIDTIITPNMDGTLMDIPVGFEPVGLDRYLILVQSPEGLRFTLFSLFRDESSLNNNIIWKYDFYPQLEDSTFIGSSIKPAMDDRHYILSFGTKDKLTLINIADLRDTLSIKWEATQSLAGMVESGTAIPTSDGGYALTGTHGRLAIPLPPENIGPAPSKIYTINLNAYSNLNTFLIKTNAFGQLAPF
jgi:hypothetical protein